MPRIQDELEQFLGWMAHEMGHATFKSRESLHFTSVGWQALGLAAYDLYVTLRDVATGERERAVRQIAKLDWRRSDDNEEMIKIGVLSRVGKKVGLSGRGAAAVGALHDFILHNTDLGKLVRREPVAA